MLYSIPPLQDNQEDVYDFESLFTNIPIEETINYIIEQIYVHKKLTPILNFKLLNSIASTLNKWMVALWEDRYLLLLVTFTWSKRKMML